MKKAKKSSNDWVHRSVTGVYVSRTKVTGSGINEAASLKASPWKPWIGSVGQRNTEPMDADADAMVRAKYELLSKSK